MIKDINGLLVCDKCSGQEIQFFSDEGVVCVKCYHEEKGYVEFPEFRSSKVVTKEQAELPF